MYVTEANKSSCQTAETSKKTLEIEIKKWLGNARDRESDGRKNALSKGHTMRHDYNMKNSLS